MCPVPTAGLGTALRPFALVGAVDMVAVNDGPPVTAPQPRTRAKPAPKAKPPDPEVKPDPVRDLLRARLVAALRPRMTAVEARMTADQLLDDVQAWAEDVARVALAAHADLIAEVVTAAQDCLEIMGPAPEADPDP
jgi:hypothetical protein